MQLQPYRAFTASRQAAPYRNRKSLTQLSLPMLKNTTSKPSLEREGYREPFPTIDEALTQLDAARDTLKKLVGQKYPLDVRKASSYRKEVIDVSDNENTIQVEA